MTRTFGFRAFVGFALVAATSCRFQASPVPLEGARADISALAGQWDGEYSSVESGRTGSIMFTIKAGSDTALGDVVMIPERGQAFTAADAMSREHREHSSGATFLRVSFVRVDGGIIRGELEPYIAPDCNCAVTTVFRGARKGDSIDGQFVTRGPHGLLQEGRWRVELTKRP